MLHPRLAPALEVLHAAVAVAGDQTAKVSLVASADLVLFGFSWVGSMAFFSLHRVQDLGWGPKIRGWALKYRVWPAHHTSDETPAPQTQNSQPLT